MKTLLVVIPERVQDHVGEEYDDFITVEESMPTIDQLDVEANKIWQKIRELADEDRKDLKVAREKGELFEEKIIVYSDVSAAYNVVLVSLSDVMMQKDGVVIETPSIPEGGSVLKTLEKARKGEEPILVKERKNVENK